MTYMYSGIRSIGAKSHMYSFSVILSVIVHKLISKSGLNLEFALSLGEKNSMADEKLKKKKKKKKKIFQYDMKELKSMKREFEVYT